MSTLTDIKEKFSVAVEHQTWRDFITNATTDFEFREGIQWTNDEIATLKDRGQPQTVENEIHPIIERVKGQYKQQKTRIIYKGRNVGKDDDSSNTLSSIALFVQQQTGYEFEEGEMFEDGIISGFGVLEAYVDFDKDMTSKINLKAENCLNIFPDPNSKKYDWNEDAEFICRAKWVSYNKANQIYPEKSSEIEAYINANPVENNSQVMERNNLVDHRTKKIRIVEVWYKVWEKRRVAISTMYGAIDVTDAKKSELKRFKVEDPEVKYQDSIEAKIRVGVFIGDSLIEDKESPYEHGLFPFIPYFVYRRKNGEPYSVVRLLKDPNMEINKRRSKALHLLNTNQSIFEEGAVHDEDELRTEMSKPDGIIKYRKGYQFEIRKNIDLADSQINLQMESKSSINRISGIGEDSLNRPSQVRSGVGIQRKQMQTDIIVSPIYDNLRRTRLIIGKHIHALVKQFFTEEKVFSILDDMNQTKLVPFTRQHIDTIKENIYDHVIEEAPNVSSIQEEQFMYLAEMVKGLALPPNVGLALLPILIRISQIKNKDEVLKLIDNLQQVPPETPKMSLSLVWSDLLPEEKAFFAEKMGSPELAQMELQQKDPMMDSVNMNISRQGNQEIPARAEGGPVQQGSPYIVGERGPEIIIPEQNGMVIPNNSLREPFQGENDYFKANQHVGGMADFGSNKIVMNPYSNLSPQEKQSVMQNEHARLIMRKNNIVPDFDLTPEQASAFKDYGGGDPRAIKETIVGRIISGDPSAGKYTPEQKAFANNIMKRIMNKGLNQFKD